MKALKMRRGDVGPREVVVLEERFRNSRDSDTAKNKSRRKSLTQGRFLILSMPILPVLGQDSQHMLALYKIHTGLLRKAPVPPQSPSAL